MVKEGHDSTVRPKVQTYEFDGGRLYLDAWAADGKANFSRAFLGRMRVLNVLLCTGMGAVLLCHDWGEKEHILSPLQRTARSWWGTFFAMDVADVRKAQSVGARVGN
jgi:hypothetical protein